MLSCDDVASPPLNEATNPKWGDHPTPRRPPTPILGDHLFGKGRELTDDAWSNLFIEKGMVDRAELTTLYRWYGQSPQSVAKRKRTWMRSGTIRSHKHNAGRRGIMNSPNHKQQLREANRHTRNA